MATNWGDGFLVAVRGLLATIPGLPTTQAWMNTTVSPSPESPFISDRILAYRKEDAECGPGAKKRRTIAYLVMLNWPVNKDGFDTLAMSAAIEDGFQAASDASSLTVPGGDPIELLTVDAGPTSELPDFLQYPVRLTLQFDHP